MSSKIVLRGSFKDYVGFYKLLLLRWDVPGNSGPTASGLQSRPCNCQLVPAI